MELLTPVLEVYLAQLALLVHRVYSQDLKDLKEILGQLAHREVQLAHPVLKDLQVLFLVPLAPKALEDCRDRAVRLVVRLALKAPLVQKVIKETLVPQALITDRDICFSLQLRLQQC
jgi:hypothetical protein